MKKQDEEKKWFEIEVDGKLIGIIEDGTKLEAERKRIAGLIGVEIREASVNNLIKFKTKTVIPKKMIDKFSKAQTKPEKQRSPWSLA